MAALDEADRERRAIVAVGPGIGKGKAAGALVGRLLRGKRTMVLDADGLNLLAATGKPRPGGGPAVVMTPHPGEFSRLAEPLGIRPSATDPASRPAAAEKLALAHRAVVVLKGEHTVVCDGEKTYVNSTGNPALATAGSGDVLTGLIAALLAQHMTPFDAAVLGVYLHGLAGDLWSREAGPSGLRAVDLADLLPKAKRKDEV
jgi:NAD(P)H-hydrate epimerase